MTFGPSFTTTITAADSWCNSLVMPWYSSYSAGSSSVIAKVTEFNNINYWGEDSRVGVDRKWRSKKMGLESGSVLLYNILLDNWRTGVPLPGKKLTGGWGDSLT